MKTTKKKGASRKVAPKAKVANKKVAKPQAKSKVKQTGRRGMSLVMSKLAANVAENPTRKVQIKVVPGSLEDIVKGIVDMCLAIRRPEYPKPFDTAKDYRVFESVDRPVSDNKETVDVKATKENDAVNHPAHYTSGKIEVIDFIEDQKLAYHLGNAVKYIARAGKKDVLKTIEDLRKAQWYLSREISNLEKEIN
jgi:hypothetical protein